MITDIHIIDEPNDLAYLLGSVKLPDKYISIQCIKKWWEEWRELDTQPETDEEFIDWLINNKGCSRVEPHLQCFLRY